MKLTIKQLSQCKFGAYCAIIAGLCYAVLTVFAFLLPPSIASYIASEQYFIDFKHIKYLFLTLKLFHSVANLAMIGVVLVFLSLVRDSNYGVVLWVTIVAILGYSVGIFQNIQDASVIPHLALQYDTGNVMLREFIIAIGVANPFVFIVSLGLPGIWFIVVSFLGFTNKSIPRLLIVLGFLWGVGNIMTAIAHAFVIIDLIYLVAFGAFVFAPLWGFLEGYYLFQLIKQNKI
ncbi:hypothetical protein DID76_04685 [Candidatus Marinamargulisbacteria bacterium SCGC AG-414-C22]|nr:hypothetical protein DID76_04685 [Candidatus Marinamargulisbacteria bacterium SCGC AG-414-C22]